MYSVFVCASGFKWIAAKTNNSTDHFVPIFNILNYFHAKINIVAAWNSLTFLGSSLLELDNIWFDDTFKKDKRTKCFIWLNHV